ncbi:MAG: exodeoxyribonuclease VII small subunit [Dehalococcoidia bacterium]|nr:exodeoxyribonuclease VII small subunit [Dehalococcoidia bacterium]
MADKHDDQTFEQLYAHLEERVARLEQGGLSLDDAIAVYEEGMTLARQCQEQLDTAELKITRLKESFTAPPGDDAAQHEPPDEVEYVEEAPLDDDDAFP